MTRPLMIVLLMLLASVHLARAEPLEVRIAWLERLRDPGPTLSNLDPVPQDEGRAGAMLGIADNATTGRFLGHRYEIETFAGESDAEFAQAARAALAAASFVVVDAPAADLLEVADMAPEGTLLFNAGAADVALRSADCRANVLHSLPSRAMLADALAQFAVWKKWTDWALIVGPRPDDAALAEAFRAAAAKFRLRIRGEKAWTFDADMRRNAAQEVPRFTQAFRSHQMLVVADEANDFARYVLYNTWDPVPVAGSDGLVPAAWHRAVEQHGAAQLQSRFRKLAGREMRPVDWAAWAAVRAIGEAVTRTGAADPARVRSYLLSDDFELGGFKGRPLSFRRWNGQMRQPVPLAHHTAVVATAPLEGFLHQRSELDTLGLDAPDSACTAFGD